MNCQRCRERASVHLTESIEGSTREIHLCVECARKTGVLVSQAPPELGLDTVVQTLIKTHVGELVGALARLRCPDCGIGFMEFRTGGRLGCPNDYALFQAGLLPLVRRTHGASRHVGKRPARISAAAAARLRLRSELREAVAREDYEAAARLRDRLREKDSDE